MRYYDDELYHYGRLGMKWGKHIFGDPKQRAIRKTYGIKNLSEVDKYSMTVGKQERRKAGIKSGLISDKISKGSTIVRYSDKAREDPNKTKYASLTENDRRNYGFYAQTGALTAVKDKRLKDTHVYEHTLEAVTDLKVAKGENVSKYIVKKYGDKELQQMQKTYVKAGFRYVDQTTYSELARKHKKAGKDISWMEDERYKSQDKLRRFYHDVMYNKKARNEVINHYKKRKYNAIVDPEDFSGPDREFNYPVILLDPKTSVKTKRVRRIR